MDSSTYIWSVEEITEVQKNVKPLLSITELYQEMTYLIWGRRFKFEEVTIGA
jgi:hypothetical protein